MTSVAVLGTGHMGTPIAHRLLATGHRVAVWNRTGARAAPLATAGAKVAASPAEAASGAEVVITMLTDAAAVHAALFGPGGAAAALRPGACLVQMSTIGPDEMAVLAQRMPAGVAVVDAPVGGSVGTVEAGTLVIFAAGTDPAIERAEPLLRALGTVRRCGDVGAGAALKVVVNAALITGLAALREALAVADALGVGRTAALDALAGGPLGGVVRRATTTTGASFAITLAAKDTRLALRGRNDLPVAAAALQLLHAAADPDADVATLINEEM